MNQIKIGKFIAERRKRMGITQMQLSERLGITDRAVSKWENGRAMPDTSIMLELCSILEINVNDLLCGEIVTMEDYNKKMENNLLEAMKQKEQADRHLLYLEILIGVLSVVVLLTFVFVASFVQMPDWLRIVLILLGFVLPIPGIVYALRIEQIAGYYECNLCGHKYVPTYKAVSMSMHMVRTRYMRCPKCNKKSWQKKVISKD